MKCIIRHISHDSRTAIYFKKQLPLFYQTKDAADAVLHMNQQNMSDANDQARARAASARQQMGFLLFAGAIVAVSFIVFTRRWILYPISRLMQSADEIKKGNLDLCMQVGARDEIGRLSEAFNDMAQKPARVSPQRSGKACPPAAFNPAGIQQPAGGVVVVDMDGTIEVATDAARSVFGLSPGTGFRMLPHDWLREIV